MNYADHLRCPHDEVAKNERGDCELCARFRVELMADDADATQQPHRSYHDHKAFVRWLKKQYRYADPATRQAILAQLKELEESCPPKPPVRPLDDLPEWTSS